MLGVLAAVATTTACASPLGGPGSRDPDPREQYVGTWTSAADGSTLVLDQDGSFSVEDFPRDVACDSSSALAPQPEACRTSGPVTTTGTWTSHRDDPTKVWLESGGVTLAVGYEDLDSFFGHGFSIGFYTTTIDKPEPDHRFHRDDVG